MKNKKIESKKIENKKTSSVENSDAKKHGKLKPIKKGKEKSDWKNQIDDDNFDFDEMELDKNFDAENDLFFDDEDDDF